MVNTWRYFHGENAITFALFGTIGKNQISRLLGHVKWDGLCSAALKSDSIQCIHLFPNFGKKFGYGEPDAIIISDNYVFFVEVELTDLSKRKYPVAFCKQLRKFASLGLDLEKSSRKRLESKFVGNFSFEGKQALRRIFRQIKSKKRKSCLLVISGGRILDPDRMRITLELCKEIPLGWVGYNKIKKMKGMQHIVEVINHVLSG